MENPAGMESGIQHTRNISLLTGLIFLACNIIMKASGASFAEVGDISIAPTLDNIETADLLYTAGDGNVIITRQLAVSDMDSKNLTSATVRIISGFNAGEDILHFHNQNQISGTWSSHTGILLLRGKSSLRNYETALRSIQYENTNSTNPSAQTRIITFTVNDGLTNSNTVSRDIVIIPPSKAPVLSQIENSPIVYCLNSDAVPVTLTLVVTDPNSANLASARIRIINGYNQNEDFLRFTNQNGITGSWDNTSGTLTLTGNAPVSAYQTAIRSIGYENTKPSDATTGQHDISIIVSDGIESSNTVTRAIQLNIAVKAILTGSSAVCDDGNISVPLNIDLSGTGPWTFTLIRNNGNEVIYTDINQQSYTFNVQQEGTYRIKSLSDAFCTGDTTGSGYARITLKTAPTAEISGADTICQGGNAVFDVKLTGISPWSVTYLRNGSNPTQVSNILTSPYKLSVTSDGSYSISEVRDAQCTGKVSGIGIVVRHDPPTATMSGNAEVCENTPADLKLVFTGASPWNFSYQRNSGNPISVQETVSPSNIAVTDAGTYKPVQVFDKYCQGSVSGSATIIHLQAPDVSISGLGSLYEKTDDQLVLITGSPSGGTFTGPGLFYSNPNWYFLPRYAPVGTVSIVYSYQADPSVCIGYDTAVVRVLEANALIEYPGNRVKFCPNDPPFVISGINVVNAIGSFTISGDQGLVDNQDNTATIIPSELETNEYTITYSYLDGKILSITSNFEIGNDPVADFSWETECYAPGQSIEFKNQSATSFGVITESNWKIYNDTSYETATTHDVTYTFTGPGKRKIELQVITSYGCSAISSKWFSLQSPIPLSNGDFMEDFEKDSFSWNSSAENPSGTNSWTLGDPSIGFSGPSSGQYCWYTNIPGPTAPIEQSYVMSPCFDFSGMERPMVKLNIWRLFDSNRDGANMQFTADSGNSWTNLGEIGDGINWYNNYAILGQPGGSNIGWSSGFQEGNDGDWVEARHSLDMLKDKKFVQFRISYGSDGSAQNNNGIAFDNFWIGNRSRTTLLEHFTNASDAGSKDADNILNNMVNADSLNIVDLQYHTSFPGSDPFNEQEPFVSDVRLLYYGLSGVPYSVLNGGAEYTKRFDYDSRKLIDNLVYNESLLDSKFRISIDANFRSDMLDIITNVEPLEVMPATELTLHVAVIERKITGVTGNNGETVFESVVKTFLPDAAGTTLFKAWTPGESTIIENTWMPQHVYNQAELRVVAFIQDENTQEVYQVAKTPIGIQSAIGDNKGTEPDNIFILFPNPATDRINIRFNKSLRDGAIIEIFDNLGRSVLSMQIPDSSADTEISTRNWPDGVYFGRVVSRDQVLGVRKFSITR